MKLICVGEMVIDFLPGQEEASYIRKAGGAPANVAVAVARNGLEVGFCGRVGNDDFGKFLFKTLEDNQVTVCCPKLVDEAITTMAFVSLDEHGDRSFTFARKPGADMFLCREDVDNAGVKDADMVHAGSCSLSRDPAADATVYAITEGKRNGKLVSFDVNYRNVMWNDDIDACSRAVMDILKYVDLLKISEEEVDMMGGADAIPELMNKNGITLTVETLGSHGARAFFNGATFDVPGRRVKAVDATGAGDAFWGAFLAKLRLSGVEKAADLTEPVIRAALEYGNVSGCICVQHKGAITSIPTRGEIEAYMESEK